MTLYDNDLEYLKQRSVSALKLLAVTDRHLDGIRRGIPTDSVTEVDEDSDDILLLVGEAQDSLREMRRNLKRIWTVLEALENDHASRRTQSLPD